jgi:uncharacterized protein
MKKILFALLTTLIFAGAFAQDSEKTAHIKKLLDLTGSGKLGVQVVQTMITSFKQNTESVPDKFWDEMAKEINADTMVSMVIPVYEKYYTDEEILQMIAFYETPVGKKVIATLPFIMKESMEIGQEWGKQVGEKVYLRLKEKGYLKNEN